MTLASTDAGVSLYSPIEMRYGCLGSSHYLSSLRVIYDEASIPAVAAVNLLPVIRDPEERLHGPLHRYYEGNGYLGLANGAWLSCSYGCFQYSSGRIDLSCYLNGKQDSGPPSMNGDGNMDVGSSVVFTGQVQNWGRLGGKPEPIISDKPVFLEAPEAKVVNRSFKIDSASGMSFCISLSSQHVHVGPEQFNFAYLRFSLVNLILETTEIAPIPLPALTVTEVTDHEGTEEKPVPENSGSAREIPLNSQLPVQVGNMTIFLRPVPDYDDIVEELWHRGGVAVTTHAIIVPDPASGDTVEGIYRSMDELCRLLSLARGTTIHFLISDCVSAEGEVIASFSFHNARLSRFSGRTVMSLLEGGALRKYLESAHTNLTTAEEKWNISRAIDLLTDAKAQGDLLELRGLKLANCLELLRQRFLSRTNKEYIVDPKLFERKAKQIRREIRAVLREHMPPDLLNLNEDEYAATLNTIVGQCSALNRTPLKVALDGMNQAVGLEIGPEELNSIGNIRNLLVHQADFDPKYGEPYEQYTLLETYVTRLLLAALGFDSPGPVKDLAPE